MERSTRELAALALLATGTLLALYLPLSLSAPTSGPNLQLPPGSRATLHGYLRPAAGGASLEGRELHLLVTADGRVPLLTPFGVPSLPGLAAATGTWRDSPHGPVFEASALRPVAQDCLPLSDLSRPAILADLVDRCVRVEGKPSWPQTAPSRTCPARGHLHTDTGGLQLGAPAEAAALPPRAHIALEGRIAYACSGFHLDDWVPA